MAEYEAEGEIERVYRQIRQILRVSGVNPNFRTWAAFGDFLPAMWSAMRPNLETRAFENAADRVRREAVRLAAGFPPLGALETSRPGESQSYQIRMGDLYHYINPNLRVLTSAECHALEGGKPGGPRMDPGGLIERGEPVDMFSMEMASEDPDDERLTAISDDIKSTLNLPSINSDYQTLALWPEYLAAVWIKLKPQVAESSYQQAADALRETARDLARALPFPVDLTFKQVAELGVDVEPPLPDELGLL